MATTEDENINADLQKFLDWVKSRPQTKEPILWDFDRWRCILKFSVEIRPRIWKEWTEKNKQCHSFHTEDEIYWHGIGKEK